MAKPVILDVDVGVDDALAIMLATSSPELDVRGITSVSGNVHVDKTSVNALKILEALGISDIPVSRGMAKPLLRNLEVAEDFHGRDGLGDSNMPPPSLKVSKRHAVEFLIEETSVDPKAITVIATGPLTNIAAALLREPKFAEYVEGLVIMGGAYGVTAYGYGNANAVAEFNIYVDPEAAKVVFNSGIPLTAVGLDTTTDPAATLTKALHEKLRLADAPRAKLATRITTQLMTKYGFIHLHDPMAVAFVADPSLFTTRKYHVDIEIVSDLTRGQTVTDKRDWLPESYRRPPNVNVCTGVQGERFLKMFKDRLTTT